MALESINFYSAIDWFEGIGGFDIILPFLLIFAITFAILQRIKVLGDKKNINTVVSLIIAFFLVIQQGLVEVIQGFLPRISMIILVLLMILLVVGLFSGSAEWGGWLLGFGVIVAILAVLWAMGAALEWEVPLLDRFTEQDIAVLVIIGVFILVVWLIIKEPSSLDKGEKGLGKWLENLGKSVKKGGP